MTGTLLDYNSGMKHVKVRDFQRDFYKIKGEFLEVMNGEGEKVGTWIPNNGLGNSDGQTLEESLGNLKKSEPQSENNGLGNSDGHGNVGHLCDKCSLMSLQCYSTWEDGEEYVACLNCIKKTVSPKILKSYLAKLAKL